MMRRFELVISLIVLELCIATIARAFETTTDGMRGSIEYWIIEIEATIDSLETAGEVEEVLSCYRAILNCYRVVIGQLDAVDMLREYGPPE